MAGKLDAQLTKQIKIHLEQCPDCQRVWREMSASMKQVSQANSPHGSDHCRCSACQSHATAATGIDAALVVHSGLPETQFAFAR